MRTLHLLSHNALSLLAVIASALVLSACSTTPPRTEAPNRGALLAEPERVRSLTTAELDQLATAGRVAALAGSALCAVDAYRLRYHTVGGAGEAVTSSAAVLVPRGDALQCREPASVVMYARGTEFVREADMSRLDAGMPDAVVAATFFAAQGHIVVAPNYVGYATSNAPYHPYYNLESQAQDVIDALRAARAGSAAWGVQAGRKLFLVGYSQGGAVALATQRALERPGAPAGFEVTATAASAGAYMIGQMGETVFRGQPSVGASGFVPLLINSYQGSGDRIYTRMADVYAPPFDAQGELTKLPGDLTYAQMVAQGRLPRNLFDQGDGKPHLLTERFRQAFNSDPQHPLRISLQKNNLDGWRPLAPLMLCHGSKDELITTDNTATVFQSFKARGAQVTSVDLEDPAMPMANAFQGALDSATSRGPRAAVYHFVGMPFCQANARRYFAAQ